MGLKIKEITVSSIERRIDVILTEDQFSIIRPIGIDYFMNVSDNLPKQSMRYFGKFVNSLPYFKNRNEVPDAKDVQDAREELEKFIGDQVQSLI